MHQIDDDSRKEVLGEALLDELKAIRALVTDVPAISRDVSKLKEDMAVVKQDIAVIKAVFKDHSQVINRHDHEIKELQLKVA